MNSESLLDSLNAHLESWHPEIPNPKSQPAPIFIIGAPRSGTTLLYQYLISALELSYPSNLIARFWGQPLAGWTLQQTLFENAPTYRSCFRSHHGYADSSLLEPHEFGYFWRRWFPETDTHHTPSDAPVDLQLNQTLTALEQASGRSWLFKNLTLGMKIPLLHRLFPDMRVLYLTRDPLHIAASLLQGRQERYGDITTWWSLQPKETPRLLSLPPHEQVSAQIYYIERQIAQDLDALPTSSHQTLSYESFCTDPKQWIQKIATWLAIPIRDLAPLPDSFKFSTHTDDTLRQSIEKIYGNPPCTSV